MKVGDLVAYVLLGDIKRTGVVVQVIDNFVRDDNILVQWSCGRKWCVKEDWIELLSSCNDSQGVV